MAYQGRNLYLPKKLTLHRLINELKKHERKIGGGERIENLQVISENIAMTYSKGESK
tara:strand:+ start:1769 stop:1939 length:171 start_codon:yes stop_codon:yes gene_type:complete